MSKSLGNLYTLEDLSERGHEPREIRYLLLSGNYRQPLNFTFDSLKAARKALSKLSDFADKFGIETASQKSLETEFGPFSSVQDALLSDLNTPEALGRLFRSLRQLGEKFDRGEFENRPEQLQSIRSGFQACCFALGLMIPPIHKSIEIPLEIQDLAQQRWNAKLAKDWSTADQLRDKLSGLGWLVKDGKDGFELAKL